MKIKCKEEEDLPPPKKKKKKEEKKKRKKKKTAAYRNERSMSRCRVGYGLTFSHEILSGVTCQDSTPRKHDRAESHWRLIMHES